jgi:RHS repeat-associated protein
MLFVSTYTNLTSLRLFRFLIVLFFLFTYSSAKAQSCDNVPEGGGEGISASASIDGTAIVNGSVPVGTRVRLDSTAIAGGSCKGMAWNCATSPCTCQETGYTYERTINHTNVKVDVTSTSLNGTYSVGTVQFLSAYAHVLSTGAGDSTGPNYFTLGSPGSYTFRFQGIINTTPCNMQPDQTNEATITLQATANDDAVNRGPTSCDSAAGKGKPVLDPGKPINVTNGNMYIQQTDYRLPGIGDGLEITRTYNSKNQSAGLFGYGWTSILDESLTSYGSNLLRLNLPDGRAVYLSRTSPGSIYTPAQPLNFYGQIVKNVDNTYTLTFQDGRIHQFNANGKLVSFSDRIGNTITLTLNASGNPTTITDASGRTVTLTYDSYTKIATMSDSLGTIATYVHAFLGRLTSVTYADGSKYVFTDVFSGNNVYLTTVKDALNNVLESHTYDSQGRALTSEKAGNGTERYTLTYVSATETDVTDALNHVTKYFFDTSKGRNIVTRVEGSCGCGNSQITQWTYDDQLNVTSKTDALNHTTSYTYDTNGNRLTQTDATGTITYTYNSLGDVLTVTDQMSGVWTNTYDAHGNLLTAKDPLNNTITLNYNGLGQLQTVTDPRNNTTAFAYNTNGDLTRRTDALNNQTNIAYDTRGRVISVTNALNQVTSYEYDLFGRLKKIIYPDTNFVLLTYDLAGRRTKIKDPRGYETNFGYDAAYRLTSETNADDKITSYSYDLMSNLTGMTDALNRTTNYFYDDFNQLTKIKYPEATVGAGRLEENFIYDLAGNLLEKKDQANRITSFCYDSVNRLTTTTDAALKVTGYEYNARSQRTAVVDAISERYEFVYDALGRVTQNKKGTATMSFVYDGAGNRSQRTDYNGAPTNYSYDALNRLTTISYPDTTSATYGYDVLSRLTTATNPNGTVTLSYDNRDRISSVTDVFGQVITYAYDANSNRTQLSLNASTSATYQYDVLNRLTQLSDAASLTTTFGYDGTNKLTLRTLPNGVATSYQYDDLNRLTRLTHSKIGSTLADFQYQLSAVSNITQMTDEAGAHDYAYDTRDRLTAATHPSQPNESYTLDDVGNRTASHQGSSYSYQTFNRLVTANSSSFGYDTNGNLTSKTDSSGNWTYTWDYENRLKQATLSGGVTVTYSYDALGRRVERTSSASGTTKSVYDGAEVVRDLGGNGTTVADYLNGPGVDNKLRQTAGGTASYFVADHLGTTRAFTDASGAITSSIGYDSYGNVTSGSTSTRYTYTGRESDTETGLIYYRARWYDPDQGRFISEDPLGLKGGVNLFGYVANNPARFSDPGGLCPQNPTAYVDQKVLAGCVRDYFGWQLLDFKPSTRGGLGSFRGEGPSYHQSNPNPGNNQELTITNNAASYSISYLKYKSAELGSPAPPKYDVYGLSVGSNLTNWTGNDVPTAMNILMNQVHELGHTLDALTQIGYDDETKHPNRPDLGGKILENCVKSRGGFKYQ